MNGTKKGIAQYDQNQSSPNLVSLLPTQDEDPGCSGKVFEDTKEMGDIVGLGLRRKGVCFRGLLSAVWSASLQRHRKLHVASKRTVGKKNTCIYIRVFWSS